MHFRVTGSEKATGRETVFRVDTPNAAEARVEAERLGMEVRSVEAVKDAALPKETAAELDYQPAAEPYRIKSRWVWVGIFLGLEASAASLFFLYSAFQRGASVTDGIQFVVSALIFLGLQLATMAPVLQPRAMPGRDKPALLWISAIAMGLLLGILVMCMLLMSADILWTLELSKEGRDTFAGVGTVFAGLFWLVSVPLIVAFMRKRRPVSFLARFAAALFLGSVVEFLAAIPLLEMVKRKESCECATYTFFSMVLSTAVGFIVLGPMILLLLFARRTRAASRGFCAACGYDMRLGPQQGKCPACGAGWKVVTDAGGG